MTGDFIQSNRWRDASILIVDDLTSMRKVLRKLLHSIGFARVTEARDASEAVTKLQSESFDLIISDWNMPTMTGQELLEYVRGDLRFKDVPFVMLTSLADRDSVVAALRSGVSDYLAKPFTVQELEQKLTSVWSRGGEVCK
jgi:two-component system chemotaxis response regulator CheY